MKSPGINVNERPPANLESDLWVTGPVIVGGATGLILGHGSSAEPAAFFSRRWLPLFVLVRVAGQFASYSLVRRHSLRRDLINQAAV